MSSSHGGMLGSERRTFCDLTLLNINFHFF